MKYIYLIIVLLLLSACSLTHQAQKEYISDLREIPQDPFVFTQRINKGFIGDGLAYKAAYFSPWNITAFDIPQEKAMWAYNVFTPQKSYGENLQPIDQGFFDAILMNSNFKDYATVNKRAVTLRHLNLRAFPTKRPLLRDPNKAGEGFPFDYLQNSTIEANKPLFVSHYSKDKAWVFVKSSFAYGWVRTSDIVFIDKKDSDTWQQMGQIFLLTDNDPIYSQNGNYLFRTHIGMILPLIQENNKSYTVMTISKFKENEPYFRESNISKNISHNGILPFNSANIDAIINELLKVNYGWGGMYSQRDCSSTMRDFFAPFGIWLPRNSYQQSQVGKVISLKDLSDEEKIASIKKYAVPFETLLYRKGHIVLYAGTYHDKIVIFQNLWGVKTKSDGKEGRYIIGRTIFSTLEVGENLEDFDEEGSLLHGLESMNIVSKS